MDQRDFNRDMGDYLRRQKGEDGLFTRLKKSIPKVEVVEDDKPEQEPQDVPVEQVQAVMRGESVEPEEEDADFLEDYEPRQPWFSRMFDWFSFNDEPQDIEDVDIEVPLVDKKHKVDDDVKDMLRICVNWINRLPAKDIQDIRRSDEYVKFKQLLERYGLIKK